MNRRHLGNGATPTLEQTIAAALADDSIAAEELETLIDQLEHGIEAAQQDAVRQREHALDPGLSPSIDAARNAQENAAFLVGRLQTLLPRLERKLSKVLDAQAHARWQQDYQQVLAKRDAAVEAFQQYPELVVKLLTILHLARDVDAECARVNLAAPSGESMRLLGVEQTARGGIKLVPSILDSVAIPDLEHPGRMLWPEPRLNPALLVPKPAPDPRASSRWGELKNQEQQAAREKDAHEREQFEADAEVAQSDGGRIPVWWLKGGR